MSESDGPIIKIPLGLSVESRPMIGDLFDRARSQASLIAAGQKELDYLVDEVYLRKGRLDVKNGRFELLAKIAVKAQPDFFGHKLRAGRAASLLRHDEEEQQVVDEALAAVQNSSRLLDRVAVAMTTSVNLAEELKKIESKEAVNTHPARRFIYLKQEEFIVEVEEEKVLFKAHAVRTAVSHPDAVKVTMTPVESRSSSTVVRGLIHVAEGGDSCDGIQSGGLHEFRFVGLEDWQKAILEVSRGLKFPVKLIAVETVSTCSLMRRPADVHQVLNWPDLLEKTVKALTCIFDGLNDRQAEGQREAA